MEAAAIEDDNGKYQDFVRKEYQRITQLREETIKQIQNKDITTLSNKLTYRRWLKDEVSKCTTLRESDIWMYPSDELEKVLLKIIDLHVLHVKKKMKQQNAETLVIVPSNGWENCFNKTNAETTELCEKHIENID